MSVIGRQRQEDHEFKTSPGKVSKTLSQKQNTNKRTGSIAQVVEDLPSPCLGLVRGPVLNPKNCFKKKKTKNTSGHGGNQQ
jgi:hypothetical protein